MKKWVGVCGLLLLFSMGASAQETPKAEVFAGYSYVRANLGYGIPAIDFNGGSASFAYNLNDWLGVVGDFGGYHNGSIAGGPFESTIYTYLFGPKFSMHMGRWTPFAQTLFGGVHASGGLNGGPAGIIRPQGNVPGFSGGSANSFAMAIGGGLDANVTHHFAVRVGQIEYLMTRFIVFGNSATQNNLRVSGGIVFRF